jgi:hypothetical protein
MLNKKTEKKINLKKNHTFAQNFYHAKKLSHC